MAGNPEFWRSVDVLVSKLDRARAEEILSTTVIAQFYQGIAKARRADTDGHAIIVRDFKVLQDALNEVRSDSVGVIYLFGMSFSCFKIAMSCRSRFNTECRSTKASLGLRISCSWLSDRVSVDRPMPRSSAISRRVRPVVSASGTHSRRNLGVSLLSFPA